jgi:hypothetical protein
MLAVSPVYPSICDTSSVTPHIPECNGVVFADPRLSAPERTLLFTERTTPNENERLPAYEIAAITLLVWKKGARTTPSRRLYEPETLSEG